MATLCYAVRTLYKIMRDRNGRGRRSEGAQGGVGAWIAPVSAILSPFDQSDCRQEWTRSSLVNVTQSPLMSCCRRSTDRSLRNLFLIEGGGSREEEEEYVRYVPIVAKYAISPGCHRWPNSANWQYLWTRTRFCRRFNWIVVAPGRSFSPVAHSWPIIFIKIADNLCSCLSLSTKWRS